jgi:hypothetical protein
VTVTTAARWRLSTTQWVSWGHPKGTVPGEEVAAEVS